MFVVFVAAQSLRNLSDRFCLSSRSQMSLELCIDRRYRILATFGQSVRQISEFDQIMLAWNLGPHTRKACRACSNYVRACKDLLQYHCFNWAVFKCLTEIVRTQRRLKSGPRCRARRARVLCRSWRVPKSSFLRACMTLSNLSGRAPTMHPMIAMKLIDFWR